MSASRKMVLINDLKPFKEEWRIRLKLLHTWKTKTDYGGESLECIFADETGQKIHASCKRTLMYRVQRDIQLGEWRELENFKISAAGDTKIKPTDYRDENQFLSLASYEEIVTGKLNTFFLIDVMGQVVDLGEVAICQLKTGENRKRVNFRLRDTSSLGSSDENKVIKQVVDDWNEVDIKCISEIYLAVETDFEEISYKENDNTGLKQQSLSKPDHRPEEYPTICCYLFCFKRFLMIWIYHLFLSIIMCEGQNISTPKTPTCKRRCVLAKDKSSAENKTLHKCLQRRKKIPVLVDITNFSVSLDSNQSTKTTEQRSCFTFCHVRISRSTETNTTHVPNKRKQRQNKISVGYDIPNIDQLHDDHIEDDPKTKPLRKSSICKSRARVA
ncbi:hypothetical protein Bca52824_054690 [Brassica carinata]|uniref:Replication protein A 70 kDa DNA-binding subunit B/D first OB fold domain-containing protein n=1 Tax=Brassica carinata TaxID=52824 RepID=A0A8X7UKQ4_BRACI|nr:hypothetical protein Bca52824_054690 [Brassica carinata]